jgi:oligopeptide transport system ATP-binding protein
MNDHLVEAKNLKMYFPVVAGLLVPHKVDETKAVDDVSFYIDSGETLGLVGESGSGKSTVGLCLLQLYRPTSGDVIYQGRNLGKVKGSELRQTRRRMQMIFQDPYGSLNPRMTAADIISEPLQIHHLLPRKDHMRRVEELLTLVGLSPDQANRYPHEFSAGERQRVGIARALAVEPDFVVCDEPVSALDVCVQAQILRLLEDLQARLKLTYMFIAHDLAVVGYMSNRIAVMYRGRFVELGKREHILHNAIHPYTRALLSAIPIPDRTVEKTRRRVSLAEEESRKVKPPPGCGFRAQCPEADESCREALPALEEAEPGHWVACWKA